MDYEARVFASNIETRNEPETGKKYISGVIPYNSRSADLGGYVETIAPSAFTRTLNAGTDIKMLWSHDQSEVLGSTRAGTLSIENRADGLHFSALVPEHAAGRYESIQRGDINKMSFGFVTDKGGDKWDSDGALKVRTLTAVHLLEVSPVAWPAYEETSAAAAYRSRYPEGTTDPALPTPGPSEMTPEARAAADAVLAAEALKLRQQDELALIRARFGL